ncbi:MAG TPA: DUF4149 domain-containing protein [Pyrinomonadaceae bacterium]
MPLPERSAASRDNFILRLVNQLRITLLAGWLAVAIYFSAVVAPSAFNVLRSFGLTNAGEIAGAIVTRTLAVVNTSGLLISVVLLLSAVGVKKYYGRASFIAHTALLFIVAVCTALGEWVIAANMRGLRVAMHGQIDQVPLSDPNRIAFANLHVYSVAALSVAVIAALVVLVLMILSRDERGA